MDLILVQSQQIWYKSCTIINYLVTHIHSLYYCLLQLILIWTYRESYIMVEWFVAVFIAITTPSLILINAGGYTLLHSTVDAKTSFIFITLGISTSNNSLPTINPVGVESSTPLFPIPIAARIYCVILAPADLRGNFTNLHMVNPLLPPQQRGPTTLTVNDKM